MKLTSVNESSIFLYIRSKAYLFEEDAKLINIGLSLTFVSPIFSDIKLETQGESRTIESKIFSSNPLNYRVGVFVNFTTKIFEHIIQQQ